MAKRKLSTYNDGVVHIYRERPRKTDFSAKRNVATLEDMDFIARLDYEEASRREEDLDFAERSGFSLTLKVRTRAVPGVDNTCKAVIDGYLYDVRYIDKSRTEMWLYLEGVRTLAT
jgi:hypothetical protein